jgi:DNA-binding response OmpR family regulator
VLVVEDDEVIREEVARALTDAGFVVATEEDGLAAVRAVAGFRPDLVLLDVGLPGSDGFTAARKIRATDTVPIVFLTSAATAEERLTGFELGADDYVVKPVLLPELVARVRAVLRRSHLLPRSVWRVGELVVDEDAHTVTMCGEPVVLTAIEFSVLAALCRTPGRVISKVQLLTEVWGFDHYALNVVEVHISSLRRKLEAHGPRVVHTLRNVGYVVRA